MAYKPRSLGKTEDGVWRAEAFARKGFVEVVVTKDSEPEYRSEWEYPNVKSADALSSFMAEAISCCKRKEPPTP